jgi:amino acid adenylation domain-containing protein
MKTKHLQLSSVQQEIWFDQLLLSDLPVYNIGGYIQIDGKVNKKLFRSAIRYVVNTNDAFRTVFLTADSKPTQYFQKKLDYHLPVLNMSEHDHPENAAMSWMKQKFSKVFQLDHPPFFEFALIQLNTEKFFWFIKIHHLIADGWSISCCVQRVSRIYNALCKHQKLDRRLFLYQNFIHDDHVFMNSEHYQANIAYWKSEFKKIPERLFDHIKPDNSLKTELYTFSISRSFYNQITDVAKSLGQTTFRLFVAALYIYFGKITGNKEFVIGVPILNRPSDRFKQTMGLFVGVIPARFAFGMDLTFHSLMKSIQIVFREHFRHYRIPISEIKRSIGHYQKRPLFDIELSFERHNYAIDLNGSKGHAHTLLSGYHAQPMTMFVREFHDDMDVQVDICYQTSFFQYPDIQRFKDRLLVLLEDICQFPDKLLTQFNCLPKWEKDLVYIQWNQTRKQFKVENSIHQMLDQQAQKTPDEIAVVCENNSLRFKELNIWTDNIACKLQNMGVRPEICVGLLTERSLEMIVGIWSILKAGGAYVPIDVKAASNRISHIINDANITVVLTHSQYIHLLPQKNVTAICLDDINLETIDSCSIPRQRCLPAHLAYVMYTSGTTGLPNGVMIEHGALIHLYWGLYERIYSHVKKSCRIALNGPVSFDTSVKQIIQTAGGHCLVILSENVRQHPVKMNQFIKDKHIDVLDITPSQLTVFLEEVPMAQLDYPLTVLIGGEEVNPSLWKKLCQMPQWTTYNLYGPTECTVDSTMCKICLDIPEPVIGKPLPNTQAYILDKYQQRLPIGATGELYIGGKQLARGYLNQPDLTSEKFIFHHFDQNPSVRLFKSGDLARYQPDGNIVYLGRNDFQVKIHGIRYHLNEIEKLLGLHPSVKDCAVHVRDDHIYAFIVLKKGGNDISEWSIVEHLRKQLGNHMISVSIIAIEKLPLTPHGKIDRDALTIPEFSETRQTSFVAPRNVLESIVASVWSGILKYYPVSMTDHFLEHGGDSLAMMRLAARLYKELSVDISIKDIFDHLRLDTLCQFIQQKPQSPFAPIRPHPFQDEYPASFAQNRIWLFEQLDTRHPAYHISGGYEIKGMLDIAALNKSFQFIIQRHESLRTGFHYKKGHLKQKIFQQSQFTIKHIALNDTDNSISHIKRLSKALLQEAFDLSSPPLFKAYLFEIEKAHSVLVLNIHHIISDGWSLQIFMKELSICYQSFNASQQPDLPDIHIQYKDYTLWQKNLLQSSYGQKQKAFWHQELSGELSRIDFPTDFVRPKGFDFDADYLEFNILESSANQLTALCTRKNVSLFSMITAILKVLIFKYTDETSIMTGSPVSGRPHTDLNQLMGCFLNTIVIKSDLNPDQTFLSFLDQVSQKIVICLCNQLYPFDQLVAELIKHRTPDRHPFFDIMISEVLVDEHTQFKLNDLSVCPLERIHPVSPFDLVFTFIAQKNRIRLGILYRKQLFKKETIQRMWGHIQRLIEQIIDQPNQPIKDLNMLTQNEMQKILFQWNQTRAHYPNHSTFDQLFTEQSELTPNAIAVKDHHNRELTYFQLNKQSDHFAYALSKAGVKPGMVVGLSLDRSIDLIIAFLGILKAGAVYLPLDSDYPINRLNFMLNDTQSSFLITRQKYMNRFHEYHQKVILMDSLQLHSEPGNTISVKKNGQQAAYIIYTSGSTGVPKGIMIHHQGLCNLVVAEQNRFYLRENSRVLQFSSISFDASIMEITMALGSGGCLVLMDEINRVPGPGFVNFIHQFQLTHLMLPPSLLAFLPDDPMPSVKVLIVGGELCPVSIARKWSKNRIFINAYGPSEATVFVSTAKYHYSMDRLPIGKPIGNTSIYILDRYLKPVPIGVTGELYISGVGLGSGYINRPELTKRHFIKNPFSENLKDRLYKTGDKVKYLPDGNIEYLGRMDHQVKIRGIRIELKEIESLLYQQGNIHECAVRLDSSTNQLIAYIVFKSDSTENHIMAYLKNHLPSYMIPTHIIPMKELPKTHAGKLDLNSLPKTDEFKKHKQHAPPVTDLEKELVRIWEKILNYKPIGITDNFFELGGHSINAMQVIQTINENLNETISINTLYTYATIKDLSKVIAQIKGYGNTLLLNQQAALESALTQTRMVPIQLKGEHSPIFCVHAVEGYVFCYNELSRYMGNDYPIYAFQADGITPGTSPINDIPSMAKKYIQLMKEVQPNGLYTIVGWSFGGVVAFEMACQIQTMGDKVQLLMIDSPVPGMKIESAYHQINMYLQANCIDKKQVDDVIKSHLLALKNYKPVTKYAGKLIYVKASDSQNRREIMDQFQNMAVADIAVVSIMGGHYDMLKQPCVAKIGNLLRDIVFG